MELSRKKIIEWIAELCDTTTGSVYAWFGPNRTNKLPLPVLAKISVALDVPFSEFLENREPEEKVELRQKTERSNSLKSVVLREHELFPEKSAREIAEDLSVAYETARRHLKQAGVQARKLGRPKKQ